jgi:hypothetical protein
MFLMDIATERDFVSFKLDVDNEDVEIPIAMRIASDPTVYSLIDEFFFELHFNRELLTPSREWANGVPQERHGLQMDRVGAMDLFIKMRGNGVRAHYWP